MRAVCTVVTYQQEATMPAIKNTFKRTNRLQILLTPQERDRLDATADEQGLAPSAYARAEIIKACKRDKGSE